MSKDKNAYWKTLNWRTKLVLMTGFVDTGKDTLTLEHRIIPFSKHHVLSMKTKRHGVAYGKLVVTWGLGVVSSRKDRTNGKRPHLNPLKEGVSKSLCLPDQPEVLWEGNCGKTWSETAEFVPIALVFKQWILQYLGPASIFGWVNVVFFEDVTHIYATNVGGGKSRGIAT